MTTVNPISKLNMLIEEKNTLLRAAVESSKTLDIMSALNQAHDNSEYSVMADYKTLIDIAFKSDVEALLTKLDGKGHLERYMLDIVDSNLVDHVINVNAFILYALSDKTTKKTLSDKRKDNVFSTFSIGSMVTMQKFLNTQGPRGFADMSIHCNLHVKSLVEGYLLNKSANQALGVDTAMDHSSVKRSRI